MSCVLFCASLLERCVDVKRVWCVFLSWPGHRWWNWCLLLLTVWTRNETTDKQAAELARDAFCLLPPLFPFELIRAERQSTDRGRWRSHNRALLSHISLPLACRSLARSVLVLHAWSQQVPLLTPFIWVKLPPLEGGHALRQQVRPTLTTIRILVSFPVLRAG